MFQNYDVPVDIIVTPIEIIRVEKRRTRPMGVCWDLITERRMEFVPVLKPIKELQERFHIPIIFICISFIY